MTDRWLVLFDIDGTLLHSGGCGRAATRLAVQEVFGTVGQLDDVSFAGTTDWQVLVESLAPAGFVVEDIEPHLDRYDRVVAGHLARIASQFPIRPCVGAPEIITALRGEASVLLGLVTGNMPSLVPIKLRAAGFDPLDFKIGAFGSDGWQRPMLPPLALERARQHAGRDFAPERIVIIGDTPADITCASSIQARTIAVATGPFSVEQLAAYQPDHVFADLSNRDAVLSAILANGRPR